jgi:Fe2+ or Zn2+ uptake regulation protein
MVQLFKFFIAVFFVSSLKDYFSKYKEQITKERKMLQQQVLKLFRPEEKLRNHQVHERLIEMNERESNTSLDSVYEALKVLVKEKKLTCGRLIVFDKGECFITKVYFLPEKK